MLIRAYGYGVFVVGCAALVVAFASSPPPEWVSVLFLGASGFVTEWLALSVPGGGTYSLAFSMQLAAVLLGGPAAGGIVALMSSVPPQDFIERRPPHRIAFNAGQYVLSAVVAGYVFVLLGGVPLQSTSTASDSLARWVFAALVAGATHSVVNVMLTGLAVSMDRGERAPDVWRAYFRALRFSLIALTLLAMVLAQLVAIAGILSTLLLVVPFVVARKTLLVYQELTDAFKLTVRSLVAVVEAKDPYTRGHSERVSRYARRIAEGMGLPDTTVDKVELAALLHDVGKVGISSDTLTKPGALSSTEVDEVRLHPLTASTILSDVEFLSDVTPLIGAHHERLDGSGYPYGLTAESLPVETRILAVADSFDAMTSDRAYRAAMPYETAVAELESDAGEKLDPRCVEALKEQFGEAEVIELLETEPA